MGVLDMYTTCVSLSLLIMRLTFSVNWFSHFLGSPVLDSFIALFVVSGHICGLVDVLGSDEGQFL